jgi:hypothetical protein
MSQNEIPNIDELLSSFLDGELDARQQTEVQRLLQHDKQIAERLLELQNCKRLVSSLPYIEAPDGMLENIKASLSSQQADLSRQQAEPKEIQPRENKGARHLFLRQLLSAAAMIALVGVLAAVIYSIVAPQVTIDMPMAVEKPGPAVTVATAEKPVEPALAETRFTGRLELKTTSPVEVAAFINKAIEYNIPSDQRSAAVPGKLGESHTLVCSRQNLRALLDELNTVWDKIDSAVLLVNTDRPEGQIVVDAVTPEQISEIAKQDNSQTQIKTAKFFAAINNMAELAPGKDVMVALDNSAPALLTIPKPVLTSSEKPVTTAGETKAKQQVLLTIVVTGSE